MLAGQCDLPLSKSQAEESKALSEGELVIIGAIFFSICDRQTWRVQTMKDKG